MLNSNIDEKINNIADRLEKMPQLDLWKEKGIEAILHREFFVEFSSDQIADLRNKIPHLSNALLAIAEIEEGAGIVQKESNQLLKVESMQKYQEWLGKAIKDAQRCQELVKEFREKLTDTKEKYEQELNDLIEQEKKQIEQEKREGKYYKVTDSGNENQYNTSIAFDKNSESDSSKQIGHQPN